EEDERRRVGRLEAEGEVQEDEGVDVEVGQAEDVRRDPDGDDEALDDQEGRRAEKAGEVLRLLAEPAGAEGGGEVAVPMEEAEVVRDVIGGRVGGRRVGCPGGLCEGG